MEAVIYGVYELQIQHEELRWKEQQLFYRDMPAGEESYCPVSFDASIRFYRENEKIRFEYIPAYYEVNPHTFDKQLALQQYPSFISKEK